jgi:pyruvate/2-oxoglutarate dehydrogenase complex dihydrolipoamide acyltransferase (E2) component
VALGTDGFGRSEARAELRDHFEVDAKHIAWAALKALGDEGQLTTDELVARRCASSASTPRRGPARRLMAKRPRRSVVPQELKLPEVGEGIESGTVVAVLVKVGDRIEVDQPLLELETDKAVVEMPSTVAGVVTEGPREAEHRGAHRPGGRDGRGGCRRAAPRTGRGGSGHAAAAGEAEAWRRRPRKAEDRPAARAGGSEGPRRPRPRPRRPVPGPDRPPPRPPPRPRRRARRRSSRPRRRCGAWRASRGSTCGRAGSGILGRISADDVRRFAAAGRRRARRPMAPAAPPLPDFSRWGETERVAMTGIRKVTVRTMSTSWATVPMVTHFDEADATDFEALRQRFKGVVEKAGAKLTPTAMLLKVVAGALRKLPRLQRQHRRRHAGDRLQALRQPRGRGRHRPRAAGAGRQARRSQERRRALRRARRSWPRRRGPAS